MSADTRTGTRWLAAVLLPIGPACVAVLRYVLPYFEADSGEESIEAIAAHLGTQNAVVWLGTVAAFTLVPALYWISRLSRVRAPRLTAAAMLLAVPGYIALDVLVAIDSAAWYGVHQGYDTAVLADLFEGGHPSTYLLLGVFVVGHVIGTLLLGMALVRSRALPIWAGTLVAVSQPLHFVAYVVVGAQWLDGLAWGAMALGFAVASLAILRTPNDEWDLAPSSSNSRPSGRVIDRLAARPPKAGGSVQTRSWRCRGKRTKPAVVARLLVALVIGSAVAGCGSSVETSPEKPKESSIEAASGKALHYVAFGDSWPEGAHCDGCETFAYQWASEIEAETGRTVEMTSFMGAAEYSDAEAKTAASLLASLRESEETREAVTEADIILIATGPNSLETILPSILSGGCGGEDGFDCIRGLGKTWAEQFDAILDQIDRLRGGRPTMVRLVNAANPFLMDPEMAASVQKGFPATGGELIFELLTRATCDAAKSHRAVCVDVRPLITGPGGDQNENSEASMKAVADALMATGLAGIGRAAPETQGGQ